MSITEAVNKSRIKRLILELNFYFKEDESRMNYGHIGNLLHKDEIAVVIFPQSFYVHNNEISVNTKTLELIQLIQTELKELQFIDGKPQLLFTK
jgi:hypothetical protein